MLQKIRLAAVVLAALALAGCAGSQLSESDRATLAASDQWRLRTLEEKSLEQYNAQLELAGQLSELKRRVNEVERAVAAAPAAPAPLLSSTDLPEPGPKAPMAPMAEKAEAAGKAEMQEMTMAAQQPPAGEAMDKAKAKPAPGQDASRWDAYPDATEGAPAAKPAPKPAPAAKAAPKPAAAPSGAVAEYKAALQLVLDGKAAAGRKGMESFLKSYPKSSLAPNALYWLGETYYHEKNYAEAVVAFKKVHQRFPRHEKAAAALLKIGYSYAMLGDKDNARFYLQVLSEDYPKSEPAALAKKRLATLK